MEHIHYIQPQTSSYTLSGNKRKNTTTLTFPASKRSTALNTATMAYPTTTYKKKFKKMRTIRRKPFSPSVTNKMVKKMMHPEVKSIDNYSTSFYPNTGIQNNQITLLNQLVQGVTRGTRIGNKVQAVALEMKISALQTVYLGAGPNPINMPQTCEYLIIQQKGANKTALLIGDIKDLAPIGEYPFGYHAYLGDRKCKVLHRGVLDIDGGTHGENNYREIQLPLKMTTTYVANVGTIADIQENSLWLVLLTSTNITTGSGGSYTLVYPTYSASWRFKYIDV